MTAAPTAQLELCASQYRSGRSCEATGEFLITGGYGDDFRSLWACGAHLENVIRWQLDRATPPQVQVIAALHTRAPA